MKRKETRGLNAHKPANDHDFDGHDTIRKRWQAGVLIVRGAEGFIFNGMDALGAIFLPESTVATLEMVGPEWPVEIHEGLDLVDHEVKKDDVASIADFAGLSADGTKAKLLRAIVNHYGVII